MKCDACGAPVENGVCTYCGKKFAVESSNSADSVPQGTVPQGHFDATPKKKKGMTTCRSCGAQIAVSAKTCPYCGAKTILYDNTAHCSGVFVKCTRGCKSEFEVKITEGNQVQ